MPQFMAVTVVPEHGMRVSQIRAFVPALGEIDLLGAPSIDHERLLLNRGPDEPPGDQSETMGGAFLVPFANRIRGKLLADGRTLEVNVGGRVIHLPANWSGQVPGAEKHAIHGLIRDAKMDSIGENRTASSSSVTGLLQAGDFGGHWLGDTGLTIRAALTPSAADFEVTAQNCGKDAVPMGMGWHPYFLIHSQRREQVRLHLPARERVRVNNYDDVFPTGQVVPTRGTEFDFSAPGGRALQETYLDDNFTGLLFEDFQFDDLQNAGAVVCEITDPAAHYGLRVVGLARAIRSIQVYAPPDKQFIALEPQFNLTDPFNQSVWGNRDTGMVVLEPGQSVTYHVRLQLFNPN
jgi:aldose 1-epimerase